MRKTEQDIKRYFTENGLADYWTAFANKLIPCFRIKYEISKDEDILIGSSKLGGFPDLAHNTSWATFNNVPLSFLGQIDLKDLPDSPVRDFLPEDGMLSFFYSLENDDYSSSPHKVIWSSESAGLERKKAPKNWSGDETAYKTGAVTSIETEQSLPGGETEYVLAIFEGDHKSGMIYWEFAEPDNTQETTNKMLGYPNHSDDRLELICECISIGDKELTMIDSFTEEERNIIRDKWVLLLQLDSNIDLGMYMGVDLDCFYFWITKEDLKNKNFSKTVAFSVH